MDASWIYVTAKSGEEAESIARALVEQRLVACANVLGEIGSIYRWDGEIRSESEVAFIVKTRASLVEQVVARITEMHSYSCPCVVALPIEGGNLDYLEWIQAETRDLAAAE
jgi:periplasmic divalent cation tolerance protein